MKTVTIILTKKDARKSLRFYQFWTLLFVLLFVIGIYYNFSYTIAFSIVGFIISVIFSYFNHRYLKTKGKTVSKSIIDINSVRNSLLYYKIFIAFWFITMILLFFTGFDGILASTLFIFAIIVFYRRLKFTSSFLKKKKK